MTLVDVDVPRQSADAGATRRKRRALDDVLVRDPVYNRRGLRDTTIKSPNSKRNLIASVQSMRVTATS
jgi:hypothetical protein